MTVSQAIGHALKSFFYIELSDVQFLPPRGEQMALRMRLWQQKETSSESLDSGASSAMPSAHRLVGRSCSRQQSMAGTVLRSCNGISRGPTESAHRGNSPSSRVRSVLADSTERIVSLNLANDNHVRSITYRESHPGLFSHHSPCPCVQGAYAASCRPQHPRQ